MVMTNNLSVTQQIHEMNQQIILTNFKFFLILKTNFTKIFSIIFIHL